jgi:5,10-methylenetetrahydromethanopterin reductase
MMRDAILGLRALLAGQEFDLDDQTLKLQRPNGPFCWDLLPQVRPRVPIYLGARGPRTTKLAGELADGILIEMYVAPTEIPVRLRNFELGARQAGRDLNELNVVCNMYTFASAGGKVDNRMRAQIAYYLRHAVSDEVAARAGLDLGEVAAVRTTVESNGHWEAASLVSREMVDAFCVAGTPEMCLSKLREYKAAGVKHAILLPIGGDLNLALEIGAEYAKEDQNDA